MLLQSRAFHTILGGFLESPALTYLAALFGLFGGLALVLTHNVWSPDWRVLITLVGWITLLKTLLLILVPQWMTRLGNWFLRHRGSFAAAALVVIAIGAEGSSRTAWLKFLNAARVWRSTKYAIARSGKPAAAQGEDFSW